MFSFLYHCQYLYQTWLYIWVTRRVSYKKPSRAPEFTPRFFGGVRIFLVFCVVLLCVYVPSSVVWCPLRFPQIKKCPVRLYLQLFVWGSCLFNTMCMCLRIVVSNTYCVVFFCSCLPCVLCLPMLPVSLDYPFFIAPSVLSDVYLTVLWIFHPSQTLQFEKHASQKQIVSFTTIPPTLNIITACTCKVPITCLCTSPARSF